MGTNDMFPFVSHQASNEGAVNEARREAEKAKLELRRIATENLRAAIQHAMECGLTLGEIRSMGESIYRNKWDDIPQI